VQVVFQTLQALLVLRVQMELEEPLVHPELQALQVLVAQMATQEIHVLQVLVEQMVLLVPTV
jgi:hypothetical protein